MPAAAQPRVLVGRRVDGWLVGWLAVAVWIGAELASSTGFHAGLNLTTEVFWVGAVITAAHFGLSYHLAYGTGAAAVRKHPLVLAAAPVALALVLGAVVAVALAGGPAVSATVLGALITSVYLMTIWHYVKQTYGVARVGAGFGGVKLSEWDARILRFGLYPLWFLGGTRFLVTRWDLDGYRFGYTILPVQTIVVLRVVVAIAAVVVSAVFVRVAARQHRMPGVFLSPYVAAFLWLGLPTNPALSTLFLAAFHALQYLAVGHRAELALAADRPESHGVAWWLNIFAGAACGGLLLSRWVPGTLDARFGVHGQLLFGAAFFVFLNLHHYLIDAAIWRSKGDLIRAMGRRPGALVPATAVAAGPVPVPAPVGAPPAG